MRVATGRKRGRFRRWVVRPAFWFVAALALAFGALHLFLGSDLARERGRDLLAARLSEALARPVAVGGVDFELLPLGLELRDLEIASDRPDEAPFARVRRLQIEAEVTGFRRAAVRLRSVRIEGLDLSLVFREEGGDNIPRPPRREGGGRQLDLRIDALAVADSAVTVAERRAEVDVAARAVAVRLLGLGGTDLAGTVVAQQIELGLPRARPLPLALAARVELYRDRLEIVSARVDGPDLHARVSGPILWMPETRLELTARIDATGAVADHLGYLDGEVAGAARIDGVFRWRPEAWGFRGEVTSPRLDLFGFRLEQLAGTVAGEERSIRFDLARGRFEGGEVHGAFAVDLANRRYPSRLELGLVEGDLDRLLNRFGVPVAGLGGEVSGPFRYDFDLVAAARGRGAGTFEILPEAASSQRVPVAGTVDLRLLDGRIELPAIDLATSGQRIAASGGYGLEDERGRFQFDVRSEDLGELVALLPFAEPGALWQPSAGTGLVAGSVELAPRARFEVELELACAAVEAPGFRARRLVGSVRASEEAVDALDLTLETASGRLGLQGRISWAEAGGEADGLDLDLDASRWPLDQARPWLPFELPIDGLWSGDLHLGGSLERLSGRLSGVVAPALLGEVEVDRVAVDLDFDPERVRVDRAVASAAAGTVEAGGTLLLESGELEFAAAAPGVELGAAPLAGLLAERLSGALDLTATIRGTLDAPALNLRGELRGLGVAGQPVELEGGGRLELAWAADQLELDLDLPGLLRLRGGGELDLERESELRFGLESGSVERLASAVAGVGVEGLSGALAGEVTVRVGPDSPLAAELTLPELAFRYRERQLHSLEPVRIALDGDSVRLRSVYLGMPNSEDELFVGGAVLLSPAPQLDLRVQASLDAGWARPFLAGLDLEGRIDAIAVVRGALERPEINGQAELSRSRLIPPQIPHSLERLRAVVLLYPRALVLDSLAADLAGGTVRAKGRVELPEGGEPSYRFEATVRGSTLRWPAGWLLRSDADLALTSTADGRQLRGEVRLDRALYLQDVALSPAQLLQRVLTRGRLDVVETDDLLSTTYLAIGIRAPAALAVRNNLARLSGGGDLTVRGSLARPVLFGEVELEPGGTVEYGGNTYRIERARIAFANPARIEPVLDIVAHAKVENYDVAVRLGGTLERLETSFSSDPPLPDLDVLALLSVGAPIDAPAGGGATAVGGSASQAAETILYGQAASLLSERVNRLFGFDKLRIDPLTSGDSISAARVTVGKRISRQVYVTYSVDPTSTAQQILQVEWRLTDRLVLVLTQNGNDSYAVDARWESRF